MIPVLAASIIGLIFVIWITINWRKQNRSDSSRQSLEPSVENQSVVISTNLPQPAKKISRFQKAVESWIPLLKGGSRDTALWERTLIESDFGPKLSKSIVENLQSSDAPLELTLKTKLLEMISGGVLKNEPWREKKPWVLFLVGVNGVGKTTTLVKLAKYLKGRSLDVGVVGADTFRKAAQEQLDRGCQRVGVDFFTVYGTETSEGADPAAVVFDGLKKWASKDIILVDTSGRLHTKVNLMDELKKMKRVADKSLPGSPHDLWMIVDSTLGQNSVNQVRSFHEALGLTGLVLTKLDGLSRGGTIFQLFQELRLPLCFLGMGEGPEDLIPFNPQSFVEELFDQESASF